MLELNRLFDEKDILKNNYTWQFVLFATCHMIYEYTLAKVYLK